MKPGRLRLSLSLLVVLLAQVVSFAGTPPSGPVKYRLDRDAVGTYRVFMTSASSYTGASARITTAQVTLVVPTGTFPNLRTSTVTSYSGTGYTTLPDGTTAVTEAISNWRRGTRVNAPSESPAYDYLSFNFQSSDDTQTFDIPAGRDILLFSFTDGGICPGPVSLLLDNDPFVPNPVNSANTNPGNQISILGYGTGAYGGILGGATVCPAIDLAVSFGAVPALTAGQSAGLPVALLNAGSVTVSGPLSFSTILPANFSAPATFITNTFSCTTVGQKISCIDPNTGTLTSGSFRPLTLPVTPATATIGSTPTFSATVSSGNAELNLVNNVASVTAGSPVQSPVSPDLTTGVGPVPTLTAGQTSSLPVSVSNIGSGPTTGPTTLTLTLPANTTAPATFANGPWSCTTTGQAVACQNPNPLTNGGLTAFNVPVTPGPAAIGTTLTFSVTANTPGESNPANNSSTAQTAQPVLSVPDLTTSVGPVPTLTAGQTAQLPVSISNVGTGPATGPISFSSTLPANVSAPATFTSGAFSCTTVGQAVSCLNPNAGGLAPNTGTTFSIPITPSSAATGTTPSFGGSTAPVPGETNTPNNTAPNVSPTQPVQTAPAPDIALFISSVPSLTVGQPGSLPLTVANVGTAATTGITSCTLLLPGDLGSQATFVSGGFSCTTTGQSVVCQNPASIPTGTFITVSVPIISGPFAVGATPIFRAIGNTPGDTNPTNNTATSPTGPAVQGVPDLTTSVGPVPSLTVGQTSNLPVSISNIGNGPATGPLVFTTTLPTGISTPASFTSGGFSCTTSGQSVSCVNPNPGGLAPGSSTNFVLPITPSSAATGTTPVFSGVVQPVPGETVTTNNPAPTVSPTQPVQTAAAPDLVTSVGQPTPSLVAGQVSQIPVTISNVGNAPATGPITFTTVLPTNFTTTNGFSTGGFACSVSSQTVTCTNPNTGGLNPAISLNLSIPLVAGPGAVGTTPTFGGSTTPVPGETNTPNNTTITTASQPVQPAPSACASDCGTGVRYGLKLSPDGITYTVYLKSVTSFTGLAAQISTAQVTISLPTGTSISAHTNLQTDVNFLKNARVNAPLSNPAADYVSFGYSSSGGGGVFDILAGVEYPLFSFRRTGACTGTIMLFDNGADPFRSPNSANTNPGNQLTLQGNGPANAYTCNYTCPLTCTAPNLTLIMAGPTTPVTPGVPFNYTVTASNTGNGPATGPITFTTVLSPGLTYTSGGGNGWVCSASSQTVTCTNPGPLTPNSNSSFPLQVTPTQSGTISSSGSLTAGGSPGVTPSQPCATCPPGSTTTSVAPLPADLSVTIQQPTGPLVAGQTSTLPLTISNLLSGSAPGPLSVTITLTNGVSAPPNFAAGNGFVCTTTGQSVVCTSAAGLAGNASVGLVIPFAPSSVNVNQNLLFTASVGAAPNETVTTNNYAFLFTNSPVVGPDLSLTVGPAPQLTPGQTSLIPVTISNVGQSTATGPLTLTVTLPANVQVNGSQLPAGFSLSSSTNNPNGTTTIVLTGSNSAGITAGSSLTLGLPVTPGTGAAGPVVISATLGAVPGENNLTNNTSSTTASIGSPDLVLTIVASSSTSSGGGKVSVSSFNVMNRGTAPATGPFTLAITLPVGCTLVPSQLPLDWTLQSSTNNPNGTTTLILVNNTSSLNPNASIDLSLSLASSQSGAVLATVSPVPGETVTANNSASLPITVQNPAIQVSVNVPTFTAGQPSSLTITFGNTGNAPYTGPLTTQITLPAGVGIGTLPPGWSVQSQTTNPNGTVTYTLFNPGVSLPVGGSVTLSLPVTPGNAQVTSGISLTVSTPTNPGFPAPVSVIVINGPVSAAAPNVVITIGQPTPGLSVGQPSTLPITFTNTGNASASGPFEVSITLPAGVSISAGSLPAGWSFGSSNPTYLSGGGARYILINNTAGPLQPGNALTLNLSLVVGQPVVSTTPSVTVTIQPANQPTPTVIVTVLTPAATAPNLVLILGQPSPNLVAGQPSSFPVYVYNTGNGTAFGPITVSVMLPVGVSFNAGGLAPGVTLVSSTPGPNGTTIVVLSVPNNGGLVPNNFVQINVPVIAGSGTISTNPTVSVTLQPVQGQTTTQTQTLVITVPVAPGTAPDLLISGSQPSPALVAGQPSIINLTVTNNGTGSYTGPVSVQIALPAGMVVNTGSLPAGWFGSGSVAGSGGSTVYTFTNNSVTLGAGGSVVFGLPVTPGVSNVGQNFGLGIAVNPVAGESNTGNNTSVIVINTPVAPSSAVDLVIVGSQPSPALVAGQPSVINLTVSNNGTGTHSGPVSVQIALPAGMAVNVGSLPAGWFLSGSVAGPSGSTVYTFTNNSVTLGSGGSVVFGLPVTPGVSNIGQTFSFGIVVNPVPGESNTANNTNTIVISTPVAPASAPDLTISASVPSPNFVADQVSTMLVTVANIGNAVAVAPLSVQIALPPGVTILASQLPAGYVITGQTLNSAGGITYTLTGSAVSIGIGGSVSISVPLVAAASTVGQTFSFGLLAVPATGEVVTNNNTNQITTTVAVQPVPAPDLAVAIPNQTVTLTAGQTSNISFIVSNIGNAAAAGPLSVTFAMPVGFSTSPLLFNTGGFACGTSSNVVVCTQLVGLASGSPVTLTMPVLPTVGGTVNPAFVVTIAPATGETNLLNNVGTINYPGTVQGGAVSLAVKVLLEGAGSNTTGLMRDDLRRRSLIPTLQPYGSTAGSPAFVLIGSGTETVSSAVLSVTGVNAIVDWVLVELRSAGNPATIVATKPALLQADGDVVSALDGTSALNIPGLTGGPYYISVRHRNHLGAMSAQPVSVVGGLLTFDFTNPAPGNVYRLPGAGNYPQYVATTGPLAGKGQLWAGNTTGDNRVIFQGPGTDADPVFIRVMSDPANTTPLANFIHTGYDVTDVNLDGSTIFQGQQNEVDLIFFNIVGHPENAGPLANFIIQQQLP